MNGAALTNGLRKRVMVAVVLATLLLLTACGGGTEKEVRDFISGKYELVSETGPYATYRSNDSVDTVAADIASEAEPGRDLDESTGRYLGYEDVMVHVEPAGGGSDIEVTDAKDGYDRWGPVIIPIWGTFGGSYRSGFSGGGSGGGGK